MIIITIQLYLHNNDRIIIIQFINKTNDKLSHECKQDPQNPTIQRIFISFLI